MRQALLFLAAPALVTAFAPSMSFRSPPIDTAAAAPAIPAIVAAPPMPDFDLSSLFSTAVKWGMQHVADGDDILLAMVSPQAYWLLREWRREAFGDQEETRSLLQGARHTLLSLGSTVPELRGASVEVRTKGLFSTFHKAVVRNSKVQDVLAVRVVLRKGLSADDVYAAHDAITTQLWPTVAGRHKDYISRPKANGYSAVHDTMVLPTGQPFEMQIRSREMHHQAQYGLASHRRYKGALCRLPMAVMSGVALAPSSGGILNLKAIKGLKSGRVAPLPPVSGDAALRLLSA